MFDARDRATKRRRDLPKQKPEDVTLRARLESWIEQRYGDWEIEAFEHLDLTVYLRDTARFDIPLAERLRLLAVAVEARALGGPPRRSWAILDRIYSKALHDAPDHAWVHASRGISASELAAMSEGGEAERLNAIARRELLHARALAPQDAQIAYCLGYVLYMDRESSIEEALTWFDCALSISSTHPWARLYRAHCLHDLERWQEAAQAYALVPPQPFMGPASWRMDLATEQQAWCLLRAGDIAGARQKFEMILARYEKEPGLWERSHYLESAATEFFPDLLERVTEGRQAWEAKE